MEILNRLNITSAKIIRLEELEDFDQKFQSNIVNNLGNSAYCLVVKLETKKFVRVTFYPLSLPTILKLSFKGHNLTLREIEILSNEIQKFKIIHSTGLVMIEQNLVFEFYLNLNLGDDKYKDLISLIDKHKSKFKDIKLEKIVLEINK